MKKKARRIMRGCVIAISIFAAPAYASSPIVVEYFAKDSCTDDIDMQLRLHEVVRNKGDVIVLNCRIADPIDIDRNLSMDEKKAKRHKEAEEKKQRIWEENGIKVFYNEFCSERADNYSNRVGNFIRGSASTMVNGRWISGKYDIMPAINLGGTDDVKKIELLREGETLHLTVPEGMIAPKAGKGVLTLFAYAPSTGITVGDKIDVAMKVERSTTRIDNLLNDHKRLVPLTEERKEEKQKEGENTGGCFGGCSVSKEQADETEKGENAGGCSGGCSVSKAVTVNGSTDQESEEVPAAKTEKKVQTTFFRPVAAMKKIGIWDGSKMQYDVSLSSIATDSGVGLEKMGYVVLLQDGDRASSIIAAGQIVPSGEQMSRSDENAD